MLRNFVHDADLQRFYPAIGNDLWANKASYNDMIESAYTIVMSDMFNKGFEPRRMMVGQYLSEDSFVTGRNETRIVVIANATDNCHIILLGSNDEKYWYTVTYVDGIDTETQYTQKFNIQYKYYKYSVTGTFTGTVEICETSFDNCIIFKSLELINRAFIKENGDKFHMLSDMMRVDYDNALSAARSYYDSNDDGVIDNEEVKSNRIFSISLDR